MKEPVNIDSEIALVGALLWSGEPAEEILAAAPAEAFAMPALRAGWDWAAKQPAGQVTPAGFATAAGLNLAYVAGLANARPTWTLWSADAADITRRAACRRLAEIGTEIVAASSSPEADPLAIAERQAKAFADLATTARPGGMYSVRELLPGVLDYIEALHAGRHDAAGIPTGFAELDRVSPLRPGELTILAARPSVGKSALAMNIAANIALDGGPVGFVSLEMTARGLCARLLQSEARACIAEVGMDGTMAAYGKLTETVGRIKDVPLVICQPGRLTCSALRRLSRQLVSGRGARLIVVDYLQLILPDQRMGSRNRENEVSEASATAKAIAMDCGVPVLMLAQLNRQAEGEKPRLSHLRDSGSIEQDADAVWLLHRDRQESEGTASLTVAKNRDGDCGATIQLAFEGRYTRFSPSNGDTGNANKYSKKGYV